MDNKNIFPANENLESQNSTVVSEVNKSQSTPLPVAPEHHKHAKIILSLLFVVLLAIIGGISYVLMQENNKELKSKNNNNAKVEEITDEQIENNDNKPEIAELDIPKGFVIYRGDGFTFYYPSDWGTLAIVSGANDPVLAANFTSNTDAKLYLNSGNQDFTNNSRGGAYWDCVGFTAMGNKDIGCITVYIEDGVKRLSGGPLDGFEYVRYQNSQEVVILHQYNYFDEPIIQILFNPSSPTYYGGTLLIPNNSSADKEIMRQIARTFTVNLPEGI